MTQAAATVSSIAIKIKPQTATGPEVGRIAMPFLCGIIFSIHHLPPKPQYKCTAAKNNSTREAREP